MVTPFAFDEGEGLIEHNVFLTRFCASWMGVLVSRLQREMRDKRARSDRPPGGEAHSVKSTRRCKMLVTMVRE
jgi:hypothetical protein